MESGGDAAREGRLAPERQRWRLQPRTICTLAEALNPTWQRGFPREPGARGPGPRAPFRLALAPQPPGRARKERRKDIPYWSLTQGTAFPPTDGGSGKVNDSDFIFFLPQPQVTKQT